MAPNPQSPRAPRRGDADDPDARRLRGWIDLAVGLALFAAGAIALVVTRDALTRTQVTYLVTWAPIAAGGLTAARGIWRLVRTPPSGVPFGLAPRGLGYKSFVAWRYLLDAKTRVTPLTRRMLSGGLIVFGTAFSLRTAGVGSGATGMDNPLWVIEMSALAFMGAVIFTGVLRYSKPALIVCLIGIALMVLSLVATKLVVLPRLPLVHLDPDQVVTVLQVSNGTQIGGAVLAGVAMFFGTLRAFFTFFTTVPIGGVWIGTAALVMVLSVMSGFESDLREKILGSNAHLQITREDGDFVEWRDVKNRIDQMPGVVASTPYAVSEVVVAANNTGMNVIIKGIDPKTVGRVTDLVSDLDDREAMKRLDPIASDTHDLRVPQHPRTGRVIDPPPEDMPTPGDPIDYSIPESGGSAGGSAEEGSGAGSGAGSSHDHGGPNASGGPRGSGGSAERPPLFSGEVDKLIDDDRALDRLTARLDHASAGSAHRAPVAEPGPVVDPPPPDLVTSGAPPTDYSRPDDGPASSDGIVKVIDIPFDAPSLSRRTQALPGILVGRELVKQTHLYTGEEVRVVSPLSDPSNPDATGTPIPFNRDYRVAGIFYTGMYEYDLKYVYVTLDSLQDFLDRGDAVDGIEVRVANPDDTDAFVAEFQARFGPGYRVQDWKELNRSLFTALKLEKIAMFLVLGIVILVASFSIVGNLIMVVVEKAREIALLKTLGASDIGVMQLFAIQGLMIGLIGTVLGVGTGLLGCWAGKRFGLPLNPDVYYIDRLPIHVEPASVLAAASAGILISIAATLYPAVVAARVRPAAGMRH
ncbi:MAG TPA: FtsX-like permease family protein [Kofleriaceae bacterium]|nr:FtsX-like permease family protein [Kofleriaceae bacterium]